MADEPDVVGGPGEPDGFRFLKDGVARRRCRLTQHLDDVVVFERLARRVEVVDQMLAAFPEIVVLERAYRTIRRSRRAGSWEEARRRVSAHTTGLASSPATVTEGIIIEVDRVMAPVWAGNGRSQRVAGQQAAARTFQNAAPYAGEPQAGTCRRPSSPEEPDPEPMARLGRDATALDVVARGLPTTDEERTLVWSERVMRILDPSAGAARRAELTPVVIGVLDRLPELRSFRSLCVELDEVRREVERRWAEFAHDGIGPLEAEWRISVADGVREVADSVRPLPPATDGTGFGPGFESARVWGRRALRERAAQIAS